MAQLVKLLDYISRYENDLTRYPTQYIRLKQYQWKRMKVQWENGSDNAVWQQTPEEVEPENPKRLTSLFRLLNLRKNASKENEVEIESVKVETDDDLGFQPTIMSNPTTITQLRKLFLDQLFNFQIKWASSTLQDKSRVDLKFFRDSLLRSFTVELPDNYLLFYYPILNLKNASVDLDILIITPTECMCIKVLEDEDIAAFIGSGNRFWVKKVGETESKLLNPLIALDRMETIVTQIFKSKEIDFPTRKYLLSRNGYIDYPDNTFDLEVVDRRSYSNWFLKLQKNLIPMKSAQFKAAQAILELGQTTAMSRLFDLDDEEE